MIGERVENPGELSKKFRRAHGVTKTISFPMTQWVRVLPTFKHYR
jgi:hypothetical protein